MNMGANFYRARAKPKIPGVTENSVTNQIKIVRANLVRLVKLYRVKQTLQNKFSKRHRHVLCDLGPIYTHRVIQYLFMYQLHQHSA